MTDFESGGPDIAGMPLGPPVRAAVGLGANLGDKAGNIRTAVEALDRMPGTRVIRVSRFFRTAPVGVTDQDWFVNAAALIETRLPARRLLAELLAVERAMGRARTIKWGPRPIDLDILFYGREIIEEEGLAAPHPLMDRRRFVLVPLMDVAPDWTHPVTGLSPARMLAALGDEDQYVEPMT